MRRGIVGLMAVLFMMVGIMMMVSGVASEELHKIGDRGWIPDYNYTQWLSQKQDEHFYVGDWLLFVFDKHFFNVLEVNKTSYESCNDHGFIANYTRGGRDVVQLKEARSYYFLSTGGYCWNGMKVAIFVEKLPHSPASAPAKNGSPYSKPHMFMIIIPYAIIAFYVAYLLS